MSPAYTIGQRVRSSAFGAGTVRSVTGDGSTLKVYFDAIGGVETVNASLVAPLAPVGSEIGPPRISPPRIPALAPVTPAPLNLQRLAVECLRQGLPPPGKLASWTFGHLKARAAIDAAIARAARGEGSVLYAQAGYGQGKSHLGRLGRELAREQGLASLHVELDGDGLSLASGTRLVAALFASARLPKAGEDHDHLVPGLATILRRAAPLARRGLPPGLGAFAPFLENPTKWAESDDVIEVIEEYLSGHRNRATAAEALTTRLREKIALEPLKMDWGPIAQRRRNQAEQLGRIVQLIKVAGAKGAFVVLDELDHDFQGELDRKNAMLRELAQVARHGPIVLLLLARTLDLRGAEELVLGTFTDLELEQLVVKVIDAFAAVYPSPALAKGRGELLKALLTKYNREYAQRGWGPRFFVRATIECCEVARLSGHDTLAKVRI
jgi:hypothetical protein